MTESEARTELLSGVLKVTESDVRRGLELHRNSIVVDGSCETPAIWTEEMRQNALELIKKGGDFDSILTANNAAKLRYFDTDPAYTEEYVTALRSAGVSCITTTIDHPSFWDCIAYWTYMFDYHGDIYAKYTGVDSIRKAKEEGKVVVIWYAQHHADYVGRDLDRWDALQRIGLKSVHIAHNQRNFYGDGGEERTDAGLSNKGIDAVKKFNELGILIDTSHTGQQTTLECAQYSKDPIVSIHTACRDLFDNSHNKYDYVLKAIAEGGGVVGIYANFISEKMGTLTDWLDHVDHAVKVMGVDHVGAGTETSYTRHEPLEMVALHTEWYHSPLHGAKPGDKFYEAFTASVDPDLADSQRLRFDDWPNLTVGLVNRGYSDEDIQKIIGGNWLRVYQQVFDRTKK